MKRCRKARPARKEKTTVSTMTIRPSFQERPNEPQMSPIDCGRNRSANQCTETPRIGKTRPPSGPWNESTTMVAIGP